MSHDELLSQIVSSADDQSHYHSRPPMTEPMPDALAERLGPLLGRAHDAHRRLSLQALAPLGLSVKAVGAMTVLEAEGPLSQRRLAERQGIDRTTMVAVVDELERLGAVERRRDPRSEERRVGKECRAPWSP